jgi:hypothetical protein
MKMQHNGMRIGTIGYENQLFIEIIMSVNKYLKLT